MLKRYVNAYLSFLSFFLLVIVWQFLGNLKLLPKFVLPTPLEIIEACVRDSRMLFFHSLVTFRIVFIGLFLSVLVACILAFLMDSLQWLHKLLYPFLVVIQTIPTIVIAPILLLWLGYGTFPKLVLIISTTVFPIVISILDGFRHCDVDILTLFRVMNASKGQILWHFKIPASLPYFYTGLRVSFSYAFITALIAEWLGGFEGLGAYMIQSKRLFQYETMFAIIVLVSCISLLGVSILNFSEKKLIKWEKNL